MYLPSSNSQQHQKYLQKDDIAITEDNLSQITKKSFRKQKSQNKEFSYKKKIRIFELHQKYGNHWKMIASFFKNRTDNFIKNQFFSLIRKSLRNARKILGLYSNTDHINKMLPKVLTSFVNKQIIISLPLKLSQNLNVKQIKVKIFDFIKKYSYESICYDEIRDIDLFIIKECLKYLDEVNEKYVLNKNKKIKKKKKFNFFKFSFKRFEYKDKFKNNKNDIFNMEKFLELKNKKNYLVNIYNDFLLKSTDYNEELKKKMIEILYELGEIHLQLAKIVENIPDENYYSFFKKNNETFVSFQNLEKKKNSTINNKIIKNSKIDNKIISKKLINKKISENNEEIFINESKKDFETFKYKKLHEIFNLGNANENQTLQLPSKTVYIKLRRLN